MRDQCVRCGSQELLEIPPTPGDHSHIVTGDRILNTVSVSSYVCTDCGHLARWVSNHDDLKGLKDAWKRNPRVKQGERVAAARPIEREEPQR